MRRPIPFVRAALAALLAIGLALGSASTTATAAPDPEKAQQLVEQSTSEMLAVLRAEAQEGQVDLETVRAKLDELVLPHMDFITMTKLAVGRSWRDAERDQKRALVEEFRKLLVRTYTRSLREYEDQRLEFLPLRPSPYEDRVTVRSQVIQSGGPKIPVEYSLRYDEGRWQVYDIVVDGISLVTTYRSSFADIVSREGIAGLIEHLRRKNAEHSGQNTS